jgi:SAM-dependent methyltransferase
MSLWKAAQKAEGDLWVREANGLRDDQNDRAGEHLASFSHFMSISEGHELKNVKLGRVIEVGAGPWTQLKGILHARPDLAPGVDEFTVWEPNAARYMRAVTSCSYRTGDKLQRMDGQGVHPFPVKIQSNGGELLSTANAGSATGTAGSTTGASGSSTDTTTGSTTAGTTGTSGTAYDTVISINVLEHVQDVFQYLTGLYLALKPGGLLIFHDRYYEDRAIIDGDKVCDTTWATAIATATAIQCLFLRNIGHHRYLCTASSMLGHRHCALPPFSAIHILLNHTYTIH